MIRILIAGLLGGLAMYVWSAVAHVATPLGSVGISTMPNEAAVTSAMQGALRGKPGLYMFPAAAMEGGTAPGPSGILVYGDQSTTMDATTLGSEAAVQLLEGVIAALLLSWTYLSGYLSRVGFVTLVGVVGALSTNPSYWIWYKFPGSFILATMFVDIVGYLVAGLVIAAILRPRAAAVA